MSAIGFDIGTESCVIAAEKHGGVDVLLNYGLKRETPAVVSFSENQRYFGSAAAAFDNNNPELAISQVKRLVGRKYKEPSVQNDLRFLPFKTSESPLGGVLIHVNYLNKLWLFTPVEILGMLFAHLKQIAEINLDSPINDCVIGIPSYFTDLQRREYLDAASIAGLRPLRLIHECTAIALGYGVKKTDFPRSGPTTVVFVNIGHCDTQVSVVAFETGKMKVLSHSFDDNLGGRDFDDVLFKHFASKFKEAYNIDACSSAHSFTRLRASCEKLKKVLSENAEARLSIRGLVGDTDVSGLITREEFEILSLELLESITAPCINAVKESGLSVDKIYAIELSGSASHIPAISKKLTSVLWKEPRRIPNVSECVARGCALQCAMLSRPNHQLRYYKVQDLFPYTLGFILVEGVNKTQQDFTLFPKGSPFPSDRVIQYPGIPQCIEVIYTNKMDFPVEVGQFMIGLPYIADQKVKTELRVKLNDHGIFEIESASLLEDLGARSFFSPTEKVLASNVIIDNLYVSMTKEELAEAQNREQMLAEQDIKAEHAKEQRNTAGNFVYNTRNKDPNARAQATEHLLTCIADYRSIADSLPPGLKEEVNNECGKAEQWLNDHSPQHYSSPNNIDPLLWPEFVKFSVESLERRCEHIMRSNPASHMDKGKGMQVD
ncbi:putative Heat shock protein 70 family [Helianthus annuus]|uniref:Heat shock protein 70 family n=1 Tax=Helianthus annuus TaxID=4232 RepID=A0A251TUD9_HELAN|nr:heat shock 70 kDa protein 16 [Helianthus annuus]KAF5789805.1 putative Heat shock protein 70 family [Helianthus annuus]KAJ0892119.1 putative Heat shock protein 70 family [Helianthus annuus]